MSLGMRHNRLLEAHRQPIQGRTIAIQVLSRSEAKRLAPNAPYVVISIANVAVPHTTLRESPHRLGVLRLAFDDVKGMRNERGGLQPMTPAQAREVREFVEGRLGAVELIVVHCEAGVSRSPAVAAALWRWLEGTRGPFFETFRPNPHVYRTMVDELG